MNDDFGNIELFYAISVYLYNANIFTTNLISPSVKVSETKVGSFFFYILEIVVDEGQRHTGMQRDVNISHTGPCGWCS